MEFVQVAWVPDDDPERAWSIAAGLAADWVEHRCSEEKASGVLVTHTVDETNVPELRDFTRRHAHTSRLASGDRLQPGVGPVLSYVPDEEDLYFAMQLARKSSIAVVEGTSFPLWGWASWFEAKNLVTGDIAPPLHDPIRGAVDRLKFHGNNNFGDPFGKQQARSILDKIPMEEQTSDVILGAVLAAGVRPKGVKNLQRLIEAR
jgi:hypothetical protein